MKGQLNLEFIVAIFIFLSVLSYTLITIFNNIPSIQEEIIIENMRTKAWTISDIILFDQGVPLNWETKNLENVKRVGLAGNGLYELDRDKLNKLSEFCNEANYMDFKEFFGVGFNDILIEATSANSNDYWFCRPPITSTSSREVEVNAFGILDGEIIKLRTVLFG